MAYTTINKSTENFNVKLFTGTGSSNAVTGVGFQPDWCWFKDRDSSGNDSGLFDVVRGVQKRIRTDQTDAENTDANGLTAFGSDGFTVGSGGYVNASGSDIVSWNWKAGNSSGSANTSGSINSTVSVNTTAGFSIVSYTGNATSGATIGHGLGAVPKMIIIKNRDEGSASQDWCVYHPKVGSTKGIFLNLTNSPDTNAKYFNNVDPTSTLFTVGNNLGTNGSGDAMIAYCFAEKTGYSKFGYYKGNGNADGPFIYCGFRPAYIMTKKYSATGPWHIYDKERANPFNVVSGKLVANASSAEAVGVECDFLSNGFKIRASGSDLNGDSADFLYMAFGQTLVGTNGVIANAR